MKTITEDQLDEILQRHALWVDNLPGGVRADLSGAIFRWVDLRGADITGTKF